MRQPGIEPGSTAWEAAMITITPLSPIHHCIINLRTGRRTYRPAATFRLRNAGIYLAHLTMFLTRFVDVARIHFYPPLRGTEANKKIACSSDFISKGTETSLAVVI